jgi:hypothetical protein
MFRAMLMRMFASPAIRVNRHWAKFLPVPGRPAQLPELAYTLKTLSTAHFPPRSRWPSCVSWLSAQVGKLWAKSSSGGSDRSRRH